MRSLVASMLALSIGTASPAEAYLKFGTGGSGSVDLRWTQTPVRYFVTNRGVPGVSASEFQMAVSRSFQTWQAVETASITFEFAGFTSALPRNLNDGMNVIGFEDVDDPEFDRVLAAANVRFNVMTGAIVEAYVFFNTDFFWSTSPSGTPGLVDVESVATHEIGHMIGLGHSALGETEMRPGGRRVLAAEAVMFPIAFSAGSIDDRRLKADDIAGVSDIYPDGNFRNRHGSVSGSVKKNGAGVFGAHVVAFNLSTREVIGGFSLNSSGGFAIAGLKPGTHVLRIEPLDDADTDSFIRPRPGEPALDVDFQAKFHTQLAAVREGANRGNLDVTVVRK